MKWLAKILSPETINAYRLWPRGMITLYGLLFYEVVHWFMELDDPTNSQSLFLSAITGVASVFFAFYVNSGPSRGDVEKVHMELFEQNKPQPESKRMFE